MKGLAVVMKGWWSRSNKSSNLNGHMIRQASPCRY
jgi:hypothetical protein